MPSFPAPVGYRMPYDTDGTVGFYFQSGASAVTNLTSPQLIAWNNESVDTGLNVPGVWANFYVGLIFPELRDIQGFYINVQQGGSTLQTSADTTNGYDGTWTTRLTSPTMDNGNTAPGFWRQNAQTLAVVGVRGIRYLTNGNANYTNHYTFHVYGKPSTGQNPDRLDFWDPSTDIALSSAALDPGSGGDVTRGQSYSKTFRIKNLSSTKTATNTVVGLEMLTDTTPSQTSMFTFSYNGGAYAGTCTIPSIAPGGISQTITMQYTVSATAQNVPSSPRLSAIPQTYA